MNLFVLLFILIFANATLVQASVIEPDYKSEGGKSLMPWYENMNKHNAMVDLEFIKGMRPHHAGALSMSNEYLVNQESSNKALKALAKGIIHNQKFEIHVLDHVESLLNNATLMKTPQKTLVAQKGQAQKLKFQRMPVPLVFDTKNVAAEDVRFAKAMIIHHEGALVACDGYLANPNAVNGYLRGLCRDILRDQRNEINFMNAIIEHFDGNPADIKTDSSMIHGMEHHSMHGGDGHHMHH